MAQLLYQGHSSFRLETRSGIVIYIDPYRGPGYDAKADLILVTHDHFDHNRVDIVPNNEDCVVITFKEALTDGEYNSFEFEDVLIEAVPAYNKNHPRDCCVGYVLSVEGKSLYFPGDTGCIEEMKELSGRNIDIFFVPMDGVYTMDADEARKACEAVNAKFIVPIHTAPQYQKEDDSLFDIEKAGSFDWDKKIVVKPGEYIVI